MILPAALQGCAPSFGQWCSFAISRLRWSRSTYSFRGRFDPVQPVAVRLELVHGLAREFRRGEDGHVMLLTRAEHRGHPRPPFAISQDMVVEDEGAHVRGPQDSLQVRDG